MMNQTEAIREVIAMHAEDFFRGHLSNGCVICGPDRDSTYPCRTVRTLERVVGDIE
jgi:hypothetical protein